MNELYNNSQPLPSLVAPGDDLHLKKKLKDPQYLSGVEGTYKDLQHTLQSRGPWASAWVSEAGGIYNSGVHLISDIFLNSFWYVDQLGMASTYNTKVYYRQSLIGGNYGLLDKKTFLPNSDYFSALLWHRLMGKRVLSTKISGSSFLRAYAHCSKKKGFTTYAERRIIEVVQGEEVAALNTGIGWKGLNDEKIEGMCIMMGLPIDNAGRELLISVLHKVAKQGDRIVAVHVSRNSDTHGNSTGSLIKVLNDCLIVYEGFCRLKQASKESVLNQINTGIQLAASLSSE